MLTVAIGEITTLNHELLYDSMESRAFIAETLLTSTQLPKILCRLGNRLSIQAYHDSTKLIIAMGDIEVNLWASLSMEQWRRSSWGFPPYG